MCLTSGTKSPKSERNLRYVCEVCVVASLSSSQVFFMNRIIPRHPRATLHTGPYRRFSPTCRFHASAYSRIICLVLYSTCLGLLVALVFAQLPLCGGVCNFCGV